MRPLYETEANLEKERSVALLFEQAYKCNLHKMPIKFNLDFAAERQGRVVAFVEVKNTTYPFERYEDFGGYKISLAKWCAAEQMCRVGGVPFVLLVGFLDQVRYVRVDQFRHDGLVWWGRQDRKDPQDMEPAVVLNTNRFVMVR